VVFHQKIGEDQQGSGRYNYTDFTTVASVEGPWEVHFDPRWGGPASITFPELIDWTTHHQPGIRYYSGKAVYEKRFDVDFELQKGVRYYLQLENVMDVGIAGVKINGKDKGVLWTKPFRVEISEELKKANNNLEITVINSWYNRVAGDEIEGSDSRYTSTNIVLSHDFRGNKIDTVPLQTSGLLGPVTIRKAVAR